MAGIHSGRDATVGKLRMLWISALDPGAVPLHEHTSLRKVISANWFKGKAHRSGLRWKSGASRVTHNSLAYLTDRLLPRDRRALPANATQCSADKLRKKAVLAIKCRPPIWVDEGMADERLAAMLTTWVSIERNKSPREGAIQW